jgi:hypothetical protein
MDARNVSHALNELESDPMQRCVSARIPSASSPTTPVTNMRSSFNVAAFDDAELVAKSGLVSPGQLAHAQNVALLTAYSLGQVLIAMDYMTMEQLEKLQPSVKTHVQAALPSPAASAQESDWVPGGKESSIRIGELLAQAKVINTRELSIALGLSFTDTRRLGQIMIAAGFLSEEELRLALDCQNAVTSHALPAEKAPSVLQHSLQQGYSIAEAIFDLGYSQDPSILVFM